MILTRTARGSAGQTRRHLPSLPLSNFVASGEEPKLAQAIAGNSRLPHLDEHKKSDYLGEYPSDVGTSRCVGGTEISSHGSLPCLTIPSDPSNACSVASSFGCRALDDNLRLIAEDDRGELALFPPLRSPHVAVLQCPFDLLHCVRVFQGGQIDDWIAHSLEHFAIIGGQGRAVQPPTLNQCPFCEASFSDLVGITSWNQRMNHVAEHHRIGHTLAHARPDFALYEYLWRKRAITTQEYRDIRGNSEDRSRMVHGQPSPPMTRTASTEQDGSMRTCYSIIESRRNNRPRRPRG